MTADTFLLSPEEALLCFERYQYMIPLYISRYGEDLADDEDLSQEITMRFWEFICTNQVIYTEVSRDRQHRIGGRLHAWFRTNILHFITQWREDREREQEELCLSEHIADLKNMEDFQREVREIYETKVSVLTPRERDVLTLRSGLSDEYPEMTLKQVAEYYGLTVERIRQIENKAIRKMRHPTITKYLKDYYLDMEAYAEADTIVVAPMGNFAKIKTYRNPSVKEENKYIPLGRYLQELGQECVWLSVSDIEKLVPLPGAAYNHASFWRTHRWGDGTLYTALYTVGYAVGAVRIEEQQVEFCKLEVL